ncbi:cyanophycin synthetase [Thiobacter aerophilum]|uniref:Cyanophycin synthetase n=1 Tax=Thiobacter aerophilum TaxID=3121275 RepID=A0ABV0EEI8_9BURK
MTRRSIEFLRIVYLRGPNMWTYRPVLEAWVDIGDLEDAPSNTIPGFYERLTAWLPGLVEHRCGVGERGGFLLRLREGTWPAHILEHVTIELMNLAGMKVGFGKARSTSVRGVYKVVVRTRHETVGRACLEAARDLVMAAIEDKPFDVPATVERLRDLADRLCLGPSTTSIVDAATDRGIPHIRLTDGNLVQLGYGAKSRRIWTAETDRTPAIAESIAGDKDLTKRLLAACGVPVPQGSIVKTAAEAWEAAQDIGLPVAVKPVDANHGRGVSLELNTREEIEAAFHLAEQEGSEVIVERFVPGNEHRLLVVGGKLVAAAKGESAWVTGDGRSTVAELIDSQINTDPRRGTTEDYPLNVIRIEEDPAVRLELARQGYRGEDVPAAGTRILIQRNGNVAFDVTDRVHPEVAAAACLAARIVGLDVAGIDLVAEDISRPLQEQGGAIVEVNAGPGLLMHLKPAEGKPRPVGRAIVDHLFPENTTGRIPVVGITGRRGTTLIARLTTLLLQLAGRRTGLACRDGVFFDRRHVTPRDGCRWIAGHQLLMNRMADAAVFETPVEMILDEGLPYDRCQVGIVTDVSGWEQLSRYYIHGADQLYTVLRTQVDVVLPDGVAVLNAHDPLATKMAELCDGAVILYGREGGLDAIARHRAEGGLALFVRDGAIIRAMGLEEREFTRLDTIALLQKTGETGLESVLAAIAASLALGLPEELIRTGIETCDPAQVGLPG